MNSGRVNPIRFLPLIPAALLLSAAIGRAQPNAYTLTDLGTFGGVNSYACGINASGQVVGWAETYLGSQQAFLYSAGQMVHVGTLYGNPQSYAYAINASGQVVGGSGQAFVYSGGMPQDIGLFLGGQQSVATAINDPGQIVGYASGSSALAFLYSAGSILPLNLLIAGGDRTNWALSFASDINNSGQIVGAGTLRTYMANGWVDSSTHGFLLDHGQLIDLGLNTQPVAINASGQIAATLSGNSYRAAIYSAGTIIYLGTLPGLVHSLARDINAAGQVVGYSGGGISERAFLYDSGTMYDLNNLLTGTNTGGWVLQQATAINDSGQIAGYGKFGEATRAFLLTPVPVLKLAPARPDGMALSFWTMTNRNYTVESSTDLTSWSTLTNISGRAASVSVSDTTGSTAQKFYRLQVR